METLAFEAKKFVAQEEKKVQDILAAEAMLQIFINHQPYTITMRSPGNEQELVRGILFTEDVLKNKNLHPSLEILQRNEKGFITQVNVQIDAQYIDKGIEQKRNLMSVSSCGMCGKEESSIHLGEAIRYDKKLAASNIEKYFTIMRESQSGFEASGGTHAAAIFDENGTMLSIQEDIGRHNATDKAIGDILLQNKLMQAQCILVSGRLSFEIISKTYKAGIPFLAAVSAPSSLAVESAQEGGICLMAFCRGEQFTVYTFTERIV